MTLQTRIDRLETATTAAGACTCPTSIRVNLIDPSQERPPEELWSETCPDCGGKRDKPIVIRVGYDATEAVTDDTTT